VFDGEVESDQPQLIGLIDVAQLKEVSPKNQRLKEKNGGTTSDLVASTDDPVPSSWPASGGVVGSLCMGKSALQASDDRASAELEGNGVAISTIPIKNNGEPYPSHTSSLAAASEL